MPYPIIENICDWLNDILVGVKWLGGYNFIMTFVDYGAYLTPVVAEVYVAMKLDHNGGTHQQLEVISINVEWSSGRLINRAKVGETIDLTFLHDNGHESTFHINHFWALPKSRPCLNLLSGRVLVGRSSAFHKAFTFNHDTHIHVPLETQHRWYSAGDDGFDPSFGLQMQIEHSELDIYFSLKVKQTGHKLILKCVDYVGLVINDSTMQRRRFTQKCTKRNPIHPWVGDIIL